MRFHPFEPILTIDALRAVEARHAHDGLMERAGAAAADLATAMLAQRSGRVVVLAGPGNNGGDAFVCARHLLSRGMEVVVVARDQPNRPADAANAWQTATAAGVPIQREPPQGSMLGTEKENLSRICPGWIPPRPGTTGNDGAQPDRHKSSR